MKAALWGLIFFTSTKFNKTVNLIQDHNHMLIIARIV